MTMLDEPEEILIRELVNRDRVQLPDDPEERILDVMGNAVTYKKREAGVLLQLEDGRVVKYGGSYDATVLIWRYSPQREDL